MAYSKFSPRVSKSLTACRIMKSPNGLLESHIGCTCLTELRNVNSFTRSKNLKLNFTPRKARKSRQFWYLSRTKLTKRIAFENKCWQLNQIRLVYTQKSYISCSNLPKIGLIWPNCMPSQTFYPNLQIFLHGYIRHIRDILQLCNYHKTERNHVPQASSFEFIQ